MRLLALFALILLAGCGSGNPFGMAPISGTVKYDDGSLIPGEMIALTFHPQAEAIDAKTHPRAGRATVRLEDGTFDNVTTYEYGDGVVAGEHKVTITVIGENGADSHAVSRAYADVATTPLTITVSRDSTTFELEVAKPAKP